jgi:TonB-linked SusC/RagA family outer membrane protein
MKAMCIKIAFLIKRSKLGIPAIIACLIFFPAISFAQGKVVQGNIKDNEGTPLANVSVAVEGTKTGVTTDNNGHFSISVPTNKDVLVVSYVGFVKQRVSLSNRTDVEISMTASDTRLDSVIVVAYGTQRKVNVTGSVSSIGSKELKNRPVTNLTNALQGTMAGVTVTTTGGQPGADAGNINIRGIGTLNNSAPMVVIDGVIGDLSSVNPDDVESVSVLKDAASAAIYGSRASNGVILVTTKRGRSGHIQMSYDGYVGNQTPTAIIDFLPSWQGATLYNQARINEGQTPYWTQQDIDLFKSGTDPDGHPNTDWMGALYSGKGFQQNHYINVNGGDAKTVYSFSAGYFDQNGIVKKTSFKKYSTRLNISSNISDKLKLNANLAYLYAPMTAPDGPYDLNNMTGTTPAMGRTVVNQFQNGVYNYLSFGNPIAWLNSPSYKDNQNYNFTSNLGFDWQLLKGLHFIPSFAYRSNVNDGQDFKTADVYYSHTDPQVVAATLSTSSLLNTDSRETYTNLQGLFQYDKQLGKHQINALAGASQELTKNTFLSGSRQNFLNSELSQLNAAPTLGQASSGTANEIALQSFFSRVRYSYDNKYLLEANFRYDGSSRFETGNKWGEYPSFSAGWNISKEAFFEPLLNYISAFKLRGLWGKLGNQNIGSPYPAVPVIASGVNYSFNETLAPGIAPVAGANTAITWETTTNSGVGADMAFLNNKLNFTADYYVRNTDNILLQLPVSVVYGFAVPFQNAGAVRNSGWEFSGSYRNRNGNFEYGVSANASFNKNKITNLSGAGSISSGLMEGYPIKAFYGYETEGIFQTDKQVADHAKQSGGTIAPGDLMYKDISGPNGKPDGIIDGNDRVYLGSPFPGMTYGFTLDAEWKGFGISAFFQGASNVKNYLQGFALGSLQQADIGNPTPIMLDAWTPDNKSASFPRLWTTFTQNNPQNFVSSFWVREADYLRLKNLTVSYNLPQSISSKIGINSAKLYYSGQNIVTLTQFYKWVDPEAPAGNNGYNAFPQVITQTIGLNIGF